MTIWPLWQHVSMTKWLNSTCPHVHMSRWPHGHFDNMSTWRHDDINTCQNVNSQHVRISTCLNDIWPQWQHVSMTTISQFNMSSCPEPVRKLSLSALSVCKYGRGSDLVLGWDSLSHNISPAGDGHFHKVIFASRGKYFIFLLRLKNLVGHRNISSGPSEWVRLSVQCTDWEKWRKTGNIPANLQQSWMWETV